MTSPIRSTDLLVAVADPKVTAALQLADEVYRTGMDAARAEEAFEEAMSDPSCPTARYRAARAARARAGDRAFEVYQKYQRLLADVDKATVERVEAIVWRDRAAEYAHARQVSEREHGQR
jgi:hypothetical protein